MVWAGDQFHLHAVNGTQSWAGSITTPDPDAAAVEAVSRIVPDNSPRDRVRILVRVRPSAASLSETAKLAALLPGVSIELTADADDPLMSAANTGLAEDLLPTPPTDPTPLVVATDGSVRGGVTGLGWLSSSGAYGLRRFRHSTGQVGKSVALIAELRAIDEAVRKLSSRHLTILTDSLGALDMVRRWTAGDNVLPGGYTTERRSGVAGLVKAQRRIRAQQHRIDVQWVKGHQGHPLNEGANALARLASGNARRSGLSRAGYRQRAAGIADAFSNAYRESQ